MSTTAIKDYDVLPPRGLNIELDDKMIKRLGIGKYHSANINAFKGDLLEHINTYVSNARWCIKNGVGLYIHGANGKGKTYLASAILKEYAKRGYSCVMVNAANLQKIEIDNSYEFDSRESWKERIRSVHLLVVDDVGKEYRGQSGFVETSISNLLMERSQQKNCATIITSNVSPEPIRKGVTSTFQQIYGVGAASLILEMMRPMEIKGEDWRVVLQNKIKDRLGF